VFRHRESVKSCSQAGVALLDRVTDDDDVGIAWSGRQASVASHGVIDSTQARFCSAEMGAGDVRADSPLISAGRWT